MVATQPTKGGRLTLREFCRQGIHMGVGLLAFGVRYVGTLPLMAVALVGVLFNAWVLPRWGGRWLWRPAEIEAGRAPGFVFYPISVLALLVAFGHTPEVAAAGWGLLAFGDGAACLAGQLGGRRRLPWNRRKSWDGLLAYWLAGWVAAAGLLWWTAPGRYALLFVAGVAGTSALVAALLESSPQRLDDNFAPPLVASLLLLCLLVTEGGWSQLSVSSLLPSVVLGLAVNSVLAGLAVAVGTLDRSGAIAGGLLGTVVFTFADWRGFLVLAAFVGIGALVTRMGYRTKAARGLAETHAGRRRAANVLSNGAVAGVCALLVGLASDAVVFALAFAGALAAAAADTAESEIGQLWGRRTVLVTTWRRVEPGTDGGVSLVGTVAGGMAAVAVSAVGWAGGFYPGGLVLPLALLAVVATLLESVAGASLERRGLLDNEAVNFLNTLAGALLGAALGLAAG